MHLSKILVESDFNFFIRKGYKVLFLFTYNYSLLARVILCFINFFIQGLLVGVLEVFGLCFFAVVILFHPDFSPGLRILMMNGVFIFPVLWQVYKNTPCLEHPSFNRLITSVVALVLEIAGVSVLMYRVRT